MTLSGARRRRIASGLVALMSLVTVAGLLALTAPVLAEARAGAPTARAQGDPNFERPVVGECHDYSYRVFAGPTDPAPAVPCDAAHTAMTVAVETLPRRVHLSAKPGAQAGVYRATAARCDAAADAALGATARTRALTAYSVGFFVPTRRQLAGGARWVRCDLVLPAGRRLVALPTPLLSPRDDTVRQCLQVGRRIVYTTCAQRHNFRSTRAFVLPGRRFPGVRSLQATARRHCALGAGVSFFATWTPLAQWNAIHHGALVCYRGTSA